MMSQSEEKAVMGNSFFPALLLNYSSYLDAIPLKASQGLLQIII